MQCALTLARRGLARVHLVERNPQLGGYAALVAGLPGLGEWQRAVDWRRGQLTRAKNVEVHTSTELTAAEIADYGADIVVLATGAEWRADGLAPATHEPLAGAGDGHTVTPEQVVAGADPGRRVVVYDCEGYFMGAGMAELLAGRGHDVTLVTPLAVVGPFLDRTFEGDHARRRLHALGCQVVCETELTAVGAGACTTRHVFGGAGELVADTVVLVTARRPRDELRARPRRRLRRRRLRGTPAAGGLHLRRAPAGDGDRAARPDGSRAGDPRAACHRLTGGCLTPVAAP